MSFVATEVTTCVTFGYCYYVTQVKVDYHKQIPEMIALVGTISLILLAVGHSGSFTRSTIKEIVKDCDQESF